MADWSILDRDYSCYDYYPYYQEKEQNAPAQCVQQPFNSPSPTLTLLLSPPPQCYQPPKGENPREIRNKAEKQRRDKMNQSVLRLASIVPTVAKPGRKLNKTSVLRLAAHYLRSHQHVFGSSIDRGPEFSLEFTETLLKNLKGFLITTTYTGIVVVVSPNVQEYLGYTELELLGQNVFNIIHKDDHQLLRDQLYPRSCTLTQRGELSIPKEMEADKKIAKALANERRSFVIRFRKLNQQRSEPPQYMSCHVEGSLRKADHAGTRGEPVVHMGRRARSRGEHISTSGNDIVFVGMVRPTAETFVTEGVLESFRMEYRTRHSIDGEIIQCEQRIALVTGYMTHEVSGVNAMNFMHRDDVRWVIIALREMYDQHRLVGESCYRLMTKNGQFIYMRTLGRLDVDQNSKAVTSFVCTNTVVAEQEGKHLIKLMKQKFTLMINNNEEPKESKEEEEFSEPENEKQTPPVEDPKQLEKVILHLVTDLPSPRTDDLNRELFGNGESSSHLAIIPPRKERIHEAIEKSYSVIRSCCSTMVRRNRKTNKRKQQPTTSKESPPNQQHALNLNTYSDPFLVNLPSVMTPYSWTGTHTPTTNISLDTFADTSGMNMFLHSPPVVTTRLPPRHCSRYVDNWNSALSEPPQPINNGTYYPNNDTYYPNNDNHEYKNTPNVPKPLPSDYFFELLNDINLTPLSSPSAVYMPTAPIMDESYPPAVLTSLPEASEVPVLFHPPALRSPVPRQAVPAQPPAHTIPPVPQSPMPKQPLVHDRSPAAQTLPIPARSPVPQPLIAQKPPVLARPPVLWSTVPQQPLVHDRLPAAQTPPIPARSPVPQPLIAQKPPVLARPPVLWSTVPQQPLVPARPPAPGPSVAPQPSAPPEPQPSTSQGIKTSKSTCYSNSAPSSIAVKRSSPQEKKKQKKAKKQKVNGEPHLPKHIEFLINQEIFLNSLLEGCGLLPKFNLLTDKGTEKVLEAVEKLDGISSQNFNDNFHIFEDSSEEESAEENSEEDEDNDSEETENKDPYEFIEYQKGKE